MCVILLAKSNRKARPTTIKELWRLFVWERMPAHPLDSMGVDVVR